MAYCSGKRRKTTTGSILANPKHEAFCREIARGTPVNEAYLRAGHAETPSTASSARSLKCQPEIQKRINEILDYEKFGIQRSLQKDAERKLAEAKRLNAENRDLCAEMSNLIQRVDVINWLLTDREAAREHNQFSAAIKAVELIGRALGMFGSRTEVRHGLLDGLDTESLVKLLDEIKREKIERARLIHPPEDENNKVH
jgi:DNA segregation ATPase FtsK/SpoIIIE-like protein